MLVKLTTGGADKGTDNWDLLDAVARSGTLEVERLLKTVVDTSDLIVEVRNYKAKIFPVKKIYIG